MKKINLTNQETEFLYAWLNIPLHGEHLRARNKFIRVIEDQHTVTQDHRVVLLESLVDKDESGKPIIENGVYKLTPENRKQFSEDFNKYLADGSDNYEVDEKILRGIVDVLETRMTKGLDIEEGRVYESVVEKLSVV